MKTLKRTAVIFVALVLVSPAIAADHNGSLTGLNTANTSRTFAMSPGSTLVFDIDAWTSRVGTSQLKITVQHKRGSVWVRGRRFTLTPRLGTSPSSPRTFFYTVRDLRPGTGTETLRYRFTRNAATRPITYDVSDNQ